MFTLRFLAPPPWFGWWRRWLLALIDWQIFSQSAIKPLV
jgi:hypothetical protein